ncbi:TfoX/Sxy family protein [Demequina sp. SYSU T00192]|uniref:TfoX/Sxy family protein n=1 Tax=Demequina litoralis TaxID=3051660 RepID=A0ABT8GC73_9MICO|nr:TfoX/Sxy family protein [Demequina sp. SYSU T00192]MDN4476747.1 TfoX/Sxy family protein [Demequina sp. SYSU T00192]
MEMPRPTDAQKDAFRALVPDVPGVEVRPMFGQLAAFVGGHMFMCLFGDRVAFKLASPDLEAARRLPAGEPFAPGGRTMREYVALPLAAPGPDDLVGQALAYVSTLPPKPGR